MFSNLFLSVAAVLLFGTGAAFAAPESDAAGDPPVQRESPMDDLDTDKDGAISSEESAARANKKFDEIDADKDGSVTMEEMDTYRATEKSKHEERRAGRAAEMRKKHQEKVDPDGDGKITRDEFVQNAAERHVKNDTDGDGKVTRDEFKERFEGRREGRGEGRGERRSRETPQAE